MVEKFHLEAYFGMTLVWPNKGKKNFQTLNLTPLLIEVERHAMPHQLMIFSIFEQAVKLILD